MSQMRQDIQNIFSIINLKHIHKESRGDMGKNIQFWVELGIISL